MAGISFTGIGSGLQVNDMVDAIVMRKKSPMSQEPHENKVIILLIFQLSAL